MIQNAKTFLKQLYKSMHPRLIRDGTVSSQPIIKPQNWMCYRMKNCFSSQKQDANRTTAQQFESKAFTLLQEKKYDQALEQFTNALNIRENLAEEENYDFAQIYDALFYIMLHSAHPASLFKLEQARLNVLSRFNNENQMAYAHCCKNLGHILYTRLNREAEAKSFLLEAAGILLKDKNQSYEQALALEKLSEDLFEIDEIEICLKTSSLACEILREREKEETQQLPYELIGNAHLYRALSLKDTGDVSGAKETLEAAVEYLKKADSESQNLVVALINLGGVLFELQLNDETEKTYSKALDLLQAQKQDISVKQMSARVLHDLGELHLRKGRVETALEYKNESYRKYQELNEEEEADGLMVGCSIASILLQMGELEKSIQFYEKTIPKVLALGIKDESVARMYISLGEAYLQAQKVDQALIKFEEGIDLIKELREAHKQLLADLNYQIGIVSSGLNEHRIAIQYLSLALQEYEITLGPSHPKAINCKETIEKSKKLL